MKTRLLCDADLGWAHALNQRNKEALSDLDAEGFRARAQGAQLALAADPEAGFLLAFSARPPGSAVHFEWLATRMSGFIYVDRVAVAETARGRGVARALYAATMARAHAMGLGAIACEVNAKPPNPESDAFHAALGFTVIGDAALDPRKTVRYLTRALG
jgi:uncharacterized protein